MDRGALDATNDNHCKLPPTFLRIIDCNNFIGTVASMFHYKPRNLTVMVEHFRVPLYLKTHPMSNACPSKSVKKKHMWGKSSALLDCFLSFETMHRLLDKDDHWIRQNKEYGAGDTI